MNNNAYPSRGAGCPKTETQVAKHEFDTGEKGCPVCSLPADGHPPETGVDRDDARSAANRTATKELMDSLTWRELPEPAEKSNDVPHATHEGELEIRGKRLRCYTLSDGQRIIDADDLSSFFGVDE